jgi:hypothetical protein
MADLKISQLTAATTPLGATDVLPVVQSGTTKKVAASAIAQVGQDNSFTASQTITKTGASDTQVVLVSTLDGSNDYQSALSVRRTGTAGGALWQSKRNTAVGGVGWIAKVTANNAAEVAGTFSDAVEITNDGNLKISTGNLVIGTSGKGIDFSATPGTGTSELLSDYEEGTWTPALSFGGATTGITYSTQFGQYTKIGRQVTLTCKVVLTSKGSATGYASITGLPFNAASNVNSMTVVDPASSFSGIIVGGAILLSVASNELYFLQQSLSDRTTMSQANFGNTTDFRFVIVYTV